MCAISQPVVPRVIVAAEIIPDVSGRVRRAMAKQKLLHKRAAKALKKHQKEKAL